MGSDSFALPSLDALADHGYLPLLVVTRPDRRKGRGYHLGGTPVKERAESMSIPLLQPASLKEEAAMSAMTASSPDVIVCCAFGMKIPQRVLTFPRLGCVNLHPSLLPRYRGGAPIQRALMSGETETGVTSFFIEEGWDSGPILVQESVPIGCDEDYGSLAERLSLRTAEVLLKTIRALEKGEVSPAPQDHSRATYAPVVQEEECEIRWEWEAGRIHNLVRALSPSPGAYAWRGGKRVKVYRTRVVEEAGRGAPDSTAPLPGTVLACTAESVVVQCGNGALGLLEVQPEGRKKMGGGEYSRGYRVTQDERFSR